MVRTAGGFVGEVTKAILKKGGKTIEDECKRIGKQWQSNKYFHDYVASQPDRAWLMTMLRLGPTNKFVVFGNMVEKMASVGRIFFQSDNGAKLR